MMKKLLLLWVVLAFCSSVMAAGHIELRIAPEDVNLGGYQASDTITIQIYATGFYENHPYDTIGYMDIAAVLTDSNGTASEPNLHDTLELGTGISAGTIVNSGGVLIEDIHGSKGDDYDGVYPFPAVLWECEFHIPDAPLSSIITISLDGLSLKNVGYNDPVPMYTVGEPLEITISCMCPGDVVPPYGTVDLDDLDVMVGSLSIGYISTGGTYIITRDDINVGDGGAWGDFWYECLRMDADDDCDLNDIDFLVGMLSYEYAVNEDYSFTCGDWDHIFYP